MANPGPASSQTANTQAILAPERTTVSTSAWAGNTLRLLGFQKSVPVLGLGDIAVIPVINATSFIVSEVILANANTAGVSASAAALTVSLNGGPAVTGTSIFASVAMTALTGNTKYVAPTIAEAANTSIQTATMGTSGAASNFFYLNSTVVSAAAALVDIFIYGYDISPALP